MKKKITLNNLWVIVPIIILICLSLLNMYKVGNQIEIYNSYLKKQTIWFCLGFIVLIIIMLFKPKILFKYSKYFYFINVLLLILVLFFGKTINGSRAWFQLPFFSFQPSELMKFTLTLYLSDNLAKYKQNKSSELKFILKAFFYHINTFFICFFRA